MTPITFNLDNSLVKFVKSFAKENGITQKEVIELSLKKIRKEKLRQEIIAESKSISENKKLQEECSFLTNSCFEDYNSNLQSIENEK